MGLNQMVLCQLHKPRNVVTSVRYPARERRESVGTAGPKSWNFEPEKLELLEI